MDINDAKKLIQEEGKEGVLSKVDAKDLTLWQVRRLHSPLQSLQLTLYQLKEPQLIKPAGSLGDRIRNQVSNLSQFAIELEPTDTIVQAFPEHLLPNRLHIIVQHPS